MPGFMPGIHHYRSTVETPHVASRHSGTRPFGAGPESILTMVVMDSRLAAEPVIGPRFARTRWRRLGMTADFLLRNVFTNF
jgi:hypothetical protein